MSSPEPTRPQRSDARRNQRTLLDAAAEVFVTSGVDAPVRLIADRAGVGIGTIYRHFPSRGELIVAVYRHQVEALAESGLELTDASRTPAEALQQWADGFVDFLVTKHGLADALRNDDAAWQALHSYFVERLVPVCDRMLAAVSTQTGCTVSGYALMRGIGNLSIGAEDPRYDARALTRMLIAGVLAAA